MRTKVDGKGSQFSHHSQVINKHFFVFMDAKSPAFDRAKLLKIMINNYLPIGL